jgi:hypothetical protein
VFWTKQKSLFHARNQTPHCPVHSLLTILTLPQLPRK